LADGSVATAKIADNAVITTKLADSAVTTIKIADLNVTTGKLANTSVTLAKIADNAINSAKVVNDSLTADDIATSGVATAEILNSTILNEDVADDTLDFDVFADALVVDAATTVGVTDTNTFGISRTTEGQMLSFTDGTDNHGYYSGAGTPEGVVTADTGSLYVDTDSAVLYIKGDDADNDSWGTIGGGLSRRGTITADPAPAVGESIYTADASGGAFSITLPAATGTQTRIQIVGGDVETNAATLAVPSGEAMNGVADGTYTLNTNGQRIEAFDRGTGLWEVSVIGAGSTSDLSYVVMRRTSTATFANGATFTYQESESLGSGWDFDINTGLITAVGDKQWARFEFTGGRAANSATDLRTGIYIDGVRVARTGTGDTASGGEGNMNMSWEGAIADGTVIEARKDGSSASNSIEDFALIARELPTTESVLAGMVPVEDLHVFSTSRRTISSLYMNASPLNFDGDPQIAGQDRTYDPHGLFSGNVVTIQQDGLYEIFASASNQDYAAILSIQVDGAYIVDIQSNSGSTSGLHTAMSGKTFIELVAGQTVNLAGNGFSTGNGVTFSVRQIASKSVINTNDTPVNDQAPSGYYDIGNMRVQWGSSAQNAGAVTFPQPFASTPTVTASSRNTDVYIGIGSLTTTGFTPGVHNFNGSVSNATEFMWQAIGLKP